MDSLHRNGLSIMATTVVTAGLGYLFWLAAARLYPASDVGLAAAVIVAMNLASVVSTFGLSSLLVQRLPAADDETWSGLVRFALRFVTVFSVVAGLALFAILSLAGGQYGVLRSSAAWATLLLVGVLAWGIGTVTDAAIVAERRAHLYLLRNSVFGATKLLVLLGIARLGVDGSFGLCAAWAAGCLLSLAFARVVIVPRLGRRVVHRAPAPNGITTQLRHAALHFMAELGGQLPMYLLPIIVVLRASAEANAWFYVTWMISLGFFMVSDGVGRAMFAEGGVGHRLPRLVRKAALLVALLLVPVIAGALLLGRWVLSLYGATYASFGYPLLVILALSAPFDAATNLWVSAQRVRGRLGRVAAMTIGMAAIVIIGSWALLPTLGINAVGWAWLAAQAAGTLAIGVEAVSRHAAASSRAGRRPHCVMSPLARPVRAA